VAHQHGVIARRQLLALGFTTDAIRNRLESSRLHCLYRGVYAVGRPEVTREGRWMAAVLASGTGALLSHLTAAALWDLRDGCPRIELSVPPGNRHGSRSLVVHRRHPGIFADARTHHGIPVTSPVRTLMDCATRLSEAEVEAMVNQADKLDLIDPERLREALNGYEAERGVRRLG
jgi:hypothetical protein